MKKFRIIHLFVFLGMLFFYSCSSSKKFKSSFPVLDSFEIPSGKIDSLLLDSAAMELNRLKNNQIQFQTFSAKIRVNYSDKNGSQPEGNIILRSYKDSAIWISLSGSILNLEIYRIFITPESVTILDKMNKTIEYLPFKFMEEIAHIPLDFATLQDLLVGNPIYIGDSIIDYRTTENAKLLMTTGRIFNHILSLDPNTKLIQTSSLIEKSLFNPRTIHLFYGDYQSINDYLFPTRREIIVEDDSQIKIALNFKQVEFNKELSLSFNIPSNYKTK